jgi:hypothetical protein
MIKNKFTIGESVKAMKKRWRKKTAMKKMVFPECSYDDLKKYFFPDIQ